MVQGQGLRATGIGSGFMFWKLQFRVKGLGFTVHGQGSRAKSSGLRVQGVELRMQGLELKGLRSRVERLEYRGLGYTPWVWGQELGAYGSRFPGDSEGIRFRVWGSRLQGLRFGVQGFRFSLGFRVQGPGFRVQDLGFRIQGVGFSVQGVGYPKLYTLNPINNKP